MGRKKKETKLIFIPDAPDLKKEYEINTINQFNVQFKYLLNYSNAYKKELPEDCKNIKDFFAAINKLSNTGFQPKKFDDLWNQYNMHDITDFLLDYKGKETSIEEDTI
jgi:hypothetical protein